MKTNHVASMLEMMISKAVSAVVVLDALGGEGILLAWRRWQCHGDVAFVGYRVTRLVLMMMLVVCCCICLSMSSAGSELRFPLLCCKSFAP